VQVIRSMLVALLALPFLASAQGLVPSGGGGGGKAATFAAPTNTYVWSSMSRDNRTSTTNLIAYPFDWTSDPVVPAAVRRALNTSFPGAWTNTGLTVNLPGDYGDHQFRDISWMREVGGGKYWYLINYISPGASGYHGDSFAVFSSTDGTTLDFVTYVTAPGAPTQVWSPEWFVDDDGTVYAIVSVAAASHPATQPGGAGKFAYHLFRCSTPATMATWVYVGQLTGAAFPRDLGGDYNMIDPFMLKRDGKYIVVWKSENHDGGSIAVGALGFAASSSILGPYDQGAPFYYSGALIKGEGQTVIELPPGSQYRFRLFFDDYTSIYVGQQVYSDTNNFVQFTAPADTGMATPYWRHSTYVLGVVP
jgi:hypothetical protein